MGTCRACLKEGTLKDHQTVVMSHQGPLGTKCFHMYREDKICTECGEIQ